MLRLCGSCFAPYHHVDQNINLATSTTVSYVWTAGSRQHPLGTCPASLGKMYEFPECCKPQPKALHPQMHTLLKGRYTFTLVLNHTGLNTAVTRTPLATTHILSILSGSPEVTVPCLAAALTALYLTLEFPFILSQQDRRDITFAVCSFSCFPPSLSLPLISASLCNISPRCKG